MTWKRIVGAGALVLLALGAVALWPNVEAILTLGAAVLLVAGYMSMYSWSQRRRRRGEEASTSEPKTVPFTGWRGGGAPF